MFLNRCALLVRSLSWLLCKMEAKIKLEKNMHFVGAELLMDEQPPPK